MGEIHQLAQRVLARQRLRSISAATAASLADSTLSHCPTSDPLGQAGQRGQRLASDLPARQRQCLLAQVAITDDFEERAAIIEYEAGVPRPWAEGFAHMLIMPRPEAVPGAVGVRRSTMVAVSSINMGARLLRSAGDLPMYSGAIWSLRSPALIGSA